MSIKKKQISATLASQILVSTFAANGASTVVTSAVSTRLSTAGFASAALPLAVSTSEAVQGIVTTAPGNRVEIRKTDKTALIATGGFLVYGRITEAAGVYTLTYYYQNASAVETAYTVAGPINVNFIFPYRSELALHPIADVIKESFGLLTDNVPVRVSNIYGTAANKFVTTNGSSGLVTSLAFDAISVPFTSGAGIVATTVAGALDELKANPLPATMTQDIKLDDGFVLVPLNGNTFINLRYLADNVMRMGSKDDYTQSWMEFNTSAAKLAYGANSYASFGATTATIYADNIIAGIQQEIFSKPSSILQTVANTAKNPVVLGGRNVTINSGVVGSVGLGGVDYIMKTSQAAYAAKLVLPNVASGYETSLVSNTLVADIALALPAVSSSLIYSTAAMTSGKIPVVGASGLVLADSIMTHISTGMGFNTAAVANQIITSIANNSAGSMYAGVFKATGGSATINTALKIEAANGTTNNALEIVNGNHIHTAGLVAIGASIDTAVKMNTATSTLATGFKMINSTPGLASAISGYFTVTGASTSNTALYLNAINGTASNYALIAAAGQSVFGATSATSASALVELVSTSKGLVLPRMTTVQRLAIASPINGMMVYDTTAAAYYGYYASAWTAFGTGSLTSPYTSDIILDTSYKFSSEAIELRDTGSGFESNIITTTLTGDQSIQFPDDSGQVVLGNGSVGYMTKWVSGTKTGSSSIIQDDGTSIGFGSTPSASYLLNAVASSHDFVLSLVNVKSSGNAYGASISLSGAASSNTALLLAASGATDNYALIVQQGFVGIGIINPTFDFQVGTSDFFVESLSGSSGFGGYTTASRLTSRATTHQYAFQAQQQNATGTNYGLYSEATGAGTNNIAAKFAATGATNNYALIATAGNVGFGTATPSATAILELASTTQGLLLPRMTTVQRDAIASPVAGLVVYNTTTNKLNVYTTAWEAVTSA